MDFPVIPILGEVSEEGGDESKEGGLVGGNAGDAGPAFEFLVRPVESVRVRSRFWRATGKAKTARPAGMFSSIQAASLR